MKKNKIKAIEVSFLQEGILHVHLKEYIEITLKDALIAVVEMGKISKGKKMPVFIDAGEYCTIDAKVRVFSASKESHMYTLAEAIAYRNLGQKLLADFYVNQNNPSVPTKIFSQKKDAIKWLKTFIK